MERVRELIHRISAQEAAQEPPAALLSTVRALAAELEGLIPRTEIKQGGSVAVLLPAGFVSSEPAGMPFPEIPVPTPSEETHPLANEEREDAPSSAAALIPTVLPEPSEPSEPSKPSELSKPSEPSELSKLTEPYYIKPPVQTSFFNPVEEVPTLAQQPQPATEPQPAKEVFELHSPGESLHDRLRREEKEVAHKHADGPIRDLRKGIALNDRYLFVSELFRGDEAMYERSIKTINAFHILPEAEYWINRELKVKLGWDDSVPTVQHFYGLVRRRFS